MLLGLAMDFCESVNQESVSKIESSVSRLISEETRVIQDDAYMELKMMMEDEIGMEPINEAQITEITKRAMQQAVRKLQLSLSRFLPNFDEILSETSKFKQRVQPMVQRFKDINYVQGFQFSRELLEHLISEREYKLYQIPSTLDEMRDENNQLNTQNIEYICSEPESVSMHSNINNLFKAWQKLIKVYRNGGTDGEVDDSDEEEDSQLVSLAHYDVLAENITKLVANRPSWAPHMEFGRHEMLNSTDFVDYDKIDLIEQDEEDSQQINLQGDQDEGMEDGQEDTMNA